MEKFIVKANDDAYVYMTIRIKKSIAGTIYLNCRKSKHFTKPINQ